MPLVGSIYGRGKEYKYLAESASSFPQRENFIRHLESAGFRDCGYSELTMGVVGALSRNQIKSGSRFFNYG